MDDKRKDERNTYIAFAVLGAILLILFAFFLINNWDILTETSEEHINRERIDSYITEIDEAYSKYLENGDEEYSKEYYLANAYYDVQKLYDLKSDMTKEQNALLYENQDTYDKIIELGKCLFVAPLEGMPARDIDKTDLGKPSGMRIVINDFGKRSMFFTVGYRFTYYWKDSEGRDIYLAHIEDTDISSKRDREYLEKPSLYSLVTKVEDLRNVKREKITIEAPTEKIGVSMIENTLIGPPDRILKKYYSDYTETVYEWILNGNVYFYVKTKGNSITQVIDNRKKYNIPIVKYTDHSVESSGSHGERDTSKYIPEEGTVPSEEMLKKWKYLGKDSKTGYDKYVYYADIYGYIITTDPSDNKVLTVEQKKQSEVKESDIIKKEIKINTIRDLKKGDAIVMGLYDIKDSGKAEEMRWLVIAVEDDRILIICEHAVDERPFKDITIYNAEDRFNGASSSTWDKSDVRKWLNGTFYNYAFTNTEKKMILNSKVIPQNSTTEGVSQGKETEDRIFLLTGEEVEKYVPIDHRKCTSYFNDYGIYKENLCYWWTRSAGQAQDYTSFVTKNGLVAGPGSVNFFTMGVRPAMWIRRDDTEARKTVIKPTKLVEKLPSYSDDSGGGYYVPNTPKKDTEKYSDDEYDIDDFTFVEDFYEWYEDDFESLEDAEEYWYAHGGD